MSHKYTYVSLQFHDYRLLFLTTDFHHKLTWLQLGIKSSQKHHNTKTSVMIWLKKTSQPVWKDCWWLIQWPHWSPMVITPMVTISTHVLLVLVVCYDLQGVTRLLTQLVLHTAQWLNDMEINDLCSNKHQKQHKLLVLSSMLSLNNICIAYQSFKSESREVKFYIVDDSC